MAIPSRQIGWSTKSNLLWQISKQLEALSGIMYARGNQSVTYYNVAGCERMEYHVIKYTGSGTLAEGTIVNNATPECWFIVDQATGPEDVGTVRDDGRDAGLLPSPDPYGLLSSFLWWTPAPYHLPSGQRLWFLCLASGAHGQVDSGQTGSPSPSGQYCPRGMGPP